MRPLPQQQPQPILKPLALLRSPRSPGSLKSLTRSPKSLRLTLVIYSLLSQLLFQMLPQLTNNQESAVGQKDRRISSRERRGKLTTSTAVGMQGVRTNLTVSYSLES